MAISNFSGKPLPGRLQTLDYPRPPGSVGGKNCFQNHKRHSLPTNYQSLPNYNRGMTVRAQTLAGAVSYGMANR